MTKLVLDRLNAIKLEDRIRYWHHCTLEAYKYLSFKQL